MHMKSLSLVCSCIILNLLFVSSVFCAQRTIADAYKTLEMMKNGPWKEESNENTPAKQKANSNDNIKYNLPTVTAPEIPSSFYENISKNVKKSVEQSLKKEKTADIPNTKYHHLMANMENTIVSKGGEFSPTDSYVNGAEAYKARVKEYYASNPTPEEIENDITSVINNPNIPYAPKNTENIDITQNNNKLNKPAGNTQMQSVMQDINNMFGDESTSQSDIKNHSSSPVSQSIHKPEQLYSNQQEQKQPKPVAVSDNQKIADQVSDMYEDKSNVSGQNKEQAKAEFAQEDKNKELGKHVNATKKDADIIKNVTGVAEKIVNVVDAIADTIKNTGWFKKLKSLVHKTDKIAGVTADSLDAVDTAITANALENKADGAGFLYGGLKIMDKTAKTIFGPIGGLFTSLFSGGAETLKAGVDNYDLANKNTLQGEAQGSKNISASYKLFEFLKQSGEEYDKHNYNNGYKLSFDDQEGNTQSVNFDAIGATKVNLNGEDYYVFPTTDGEIAQTLVKIEDEPFWKFWKDDKAKVYTADIDGDIESGSYSIKNAKLIGEKEIS